MAVAVLDRLGIVEFGPNSDGTETVGYLHGADTAPIRAFLAAHFTDTTVFRLTATSAPSYG